MPEPGTTATLTDPLPTIDDSMNTSLARFRSWFQGPGRWAGWLTIPIVVLFIGAGVFVNEVMADSCLIGIDNSSSSFFGRYVYDSSCLERAAFTIGAVSLLLLLAFIFSLASIIANMTRKTGTTTGPASVAYRLQSIKDWFIRGEIDETDYDRMRKLLETAGQPTSPDHVARSATILLRSFALLLIPAAIFWTIFIVIFIDDMAFSFWSDEFAYIGNMVGGAVIGIAAFVVALVRASQMRRFRDQYEKDLSTRIDAAEQDVIRKARSRGGARAPAPMGVESGGSFTPYLRRR